MDSNRLFKFKLASHLGMTVKELEDRMTMNEFNEWLEYASLEPLLPDRLEMMLAQVVSSMAGIPAFEAMISLSDNDKEAQRQTALNNKIRESIGS